MKCFFLTFSLLVALSAMSQQQENVQIDSRDNKYYDCIFPNTNINKSSLTLYVGAGVAHTTGNLADYYKRSLDLTMSLDYYHCNNTTYSLYILHTRSCLRKEINIKNDLWTPNDTLLLTTYGFSMGYSVLNTVKWRINPFGGIGFAQTELNSLGGNKYKMRLKLSPVIGVNFSYRFINVKKEMQRDKYSGPSSCFGISARITYVPFAVNNKNTPLSGGIWYMTIGITPIEIF